MKMKPIFALGALVTLVSSACAQQQNNQQSNLGPSVGLFYPTNSEIKKDLGSSFLRIGFGGVGQARPSEGSISPSISTILASGNGNHLVIVPYTFGYEYHFGMDTDSPAVPYVRPFAGVSYYDYSITTTTGSHYGVKRLGGTAGIEGGLQVGSKLRLSAAYNFFTQTSGLNFNGLSLSATYTLF